KATDVEYDFSENNLGNNGIIYSKYGSTEATEGGSQALALGHILSWLGPVPEEYDTYDEIGKISDVIDINKIHVQDAILITAKKTADYINTNETNNLIKQTILKYGSVAINYFTDGTDTKTISLYHNDTYVASHTVSLVGWDDNYSKDNFNITPPGDGAWILKNSWGKETGINGYQYISYYDTSLLSPDAEGIYETPHATAFIIENTENYKYNYQTDLRGLRGTDKNYTFYSNEYTAVANNLLGAVGTYFNDSGIDYELKIYVNGELKITQNGTSEFSGFKTIKLNEYVPVKENDVFKVVFKNNMVPYQSLSRQHYMENTSLISADGLNWIDCAALNITSCLKVYAFDLPIYTDDLVKIYKNASSFEVNIGAANETVTFEINGRTYTRISDENGTARIAINLNPGNYTIKTTFNGTTVENKITVLSTLIGENLVKYYRNASQFYISLIDGEGNSVSGVNITMNINGVFYNRTTNENGTAKLNINLLPGEYILTATDPLTGLMMSYNITVLPTLIAEDMNMTYKDGSKFEATLLDGQGHPLKGENITFNINGVFYNRTTDENGTAKLNINLMAGEYIITSMYENGATIANKITIKS
ncbi:lectin like domain-containing protein, partial [Methanobrevibacter sp.]|uniref:lectin like domain-containing protein n=1 Tax=Methanobrevibacter sp. TaxID=66852 RepID=UPI003890D849